MNTARQTSAAYSIWSQGENRSPSMFQTLIFIFVMVILLTGIGFPSYSAAIEDRPSLFTRGNPGLVLAQNDDDDDTPEGEEEWCYGATGSATKCVTGEKSQEPTTPTVNAPALAPPTVRVPEPQTPTVRVPEPQTPTVRVPEPQTPTVRVPEPQTPTVRAPAAEIPTLPRITIPAPNTGVVQ